MSDKKTLRAALETEVKSLNELIAEFSKPDSTAVTVQGDTVTIDEKAYAAVTEHKGNIAKLNTLLGLEGDVKSARDFLDAPTDTASRFSPVEGEYKSIADRLIESEEYKDMVENNRPGMRQDVKLDVADIISYKDVYSAMASYTPTYNIATRVQKLPTVPAFAHRQRVRDLFPQARTSSNLLEYWRNDGLDNGGKGNAATVAERTADNTNFAAKPKSNLNFSSASDKICTIAHWIPAHRNTLADAPQLRSLIDNSLLYGLAEEEDWQLLNGDGVGENLLGLLRRPGIQSYVAPGGEWKSDSLRRAQTLNELAGFPSTGYVLHPLDWEDIEIQKGSTNDHYAITTNIAIGAQTRVWRLPVVSTPVINEGTFLSAAFGQACQVYDRELANIRVAEQHSDFFVRNAVVILAEERVGLVVQNPSAIVEGTFAA
jgi:HK97 family phage major capsid protein